MRYFKWLFLLGVLFPLVLHADSYSYKIKGHLIEKESKASVPDATVQLLSLPDSSFVKGGTSDANGYFSLPVTRSGKFLLKVSYIGFQTRFIPVTHRGGNNDLVMGEIELAPDRVLLQGVSVVAKAAKVQMEGDTVVFNSAAYKTSEGAKLVELVKQLPGVEIDENGTVKIHGRELKKIMVEGKEFFGGDVKTGLQNIPVGMIDKLKTYDKKSDLTRLTGVEDGEEDVVLDVRVKKGMNKGVFGELMAGAGNKGRYTSQVSVNRFNDKDQYSVIGGINNVNGRNYSSTEGVNFSPYSYGLETNRNIGINLSRTYKKATLDGSIRYDNSNRNSEQKRYSEQFLRSNRSFSNSLSSNYGKSQSLFADLRWEWKIDSLTTLFVAPRFSMNKNDGESRSMSMSFDDDPYSRADNPFDYMQDDGLDNPLRPIALNRMASNGLSKGDGYNFSMFSYFNRKLNARGRNITLGFNMGLNDNKSNSLNNSETHYYRLQNALQGDSVLYRNRYLHTPSNGGNYGFRLTYNEPIAKNLFLQFDYRYKHRNSKSTRHIYDLPEEGEYADGWPKGDLDSFMTDSLSKDARYTYNDHDVVLGLKWVTKLTNLTMGAGIKPQYSKLSYKKGNYEIDTTRTIINFSPKLDLRLNFSRTFRMMLRYRGRTNVPSIENLLPVTDNMNPLYVRVGNPGLKPTFIHSAMMFMNAYKPKTQQGIMMHLFFNAFRNQVSTSVRYNEKTGGQISMPVNVNGSWGLMSMVGGNTPLFKKLLHLNTQFEWGYDRSVSLLYDSKTRTEGENVSTKMYINNRTGLSYRNDWLEVGLNSIVRFSQEKNKLRSQLNYRPLDFGLGMNTTVQLPWKMSLSTNINRLNRSGYTDEAMNHSEWIWNAQLSQTFLKGALTVKAEVFDILKQMSNITRSFSSTSRSVSEMNGYNSYMMFSLSYNINNFGGKNMNRGRGRGPHGRRFARPIIYGR